MLQLHWAGWMEYITEKQKLECVWLVCNFGVSNTTIGPGGLKNVLSVVKGQGHCDLMALHSAEHPLEISSSLAQMPTWKFKVSVTSENTFYSSICVIIFAKSYTDVEQDKMTTSNQKRSASLWHHIMYKIFRLLFNTIAQKQRILLNDVMG